MILQSAENVQLMYSNLQFVRRLLREHLEGKNTARLDPWIGCGRQNQFQTLFQDGKNKKAVINMDLIHYKNTSTLIGQLAFLKRTLRRV